MKNYYQLSQNEVRREVNGKEEALTSSEVQQNQEKYGLNELVEGKRKVRFRYFWSSSRISLSLF